MYHADFPPVVYVPARPITGAPEDTEADASSGPRMEVEMQLMTDGRRGLFCYSAIDRLQDMYSGATGWVALTVEGLQSLYDESERPYDLLFLDRTPNVVTDERLDQGV